MERAGFTALHYVASRNSLETAELLLANNAAISAKNNVRLPADGLTGMLCSDSFVVEQNGNTALHKAAWKNSLEMA